jgi:hypothetical protein
MVSLLTCWSSNATLQGTKAAMFQGTTAAMCQGTEAATLRHTSQRTHRTWIPAFDRWTKQGKGCRRC